MNVGGTRRMLTHDEAHHDELASSTLKNFRIIFNSVRKHLSQIEALCGVSSSQLWVLWELHKSPGLRVTELAGKLSIHQSTASNLIEKLVKKSLISKKREDQDQRVVRLYLTQAGMEVILKAPGSPRGVLRDALDHLSIQDLLSLQQSLECLIGKIRLKDEADALMPLTDIQLSPPEHAG
ncbi:putative HTH-type transcriptional regulator YusO [Methylophilaceae bacterium]|nr:putative HTH-type transcriptional regulator YusO [Methylophilaceae bacterium]